MRLPDLEVNAALDAIASGGPDRMVGLSTTPLSVTSAGLSGVTEPVGGGYARVSLPASAWSAAVNRTIQATTATFPAPTGDWGVVVAWFLTDAAGVPSIPFAFDAGGMSVAAGSSAPKVTPVITSSL